MPEWAGQTEGIKFFDFEGLPTAMGIIQFCFVAHCAFPAVYRDMAEPEKYPQAVRKAFLYASLFYCAVGFCAYFVYTNHAQQSFMENLGRDINLELMPGLSGLYWVATICFFVNVQSDFPIFASALIGATETYLGISKKGAAIKGIWEVVFIVITTASAVVVKDCMVAIAGITGCFCATFPCLLLPIAFTLKICDIGLRTKVFCILGLIYGVFVLVFGTYSNVMDAVKTIQG